MPKDNTDGKTIMLVEITGSVLKHIRSTGMYANLSGHDVDYIAFMSFHGTYVAPVQSMKKRVPLNEVYPEMESKSRTNLYRVGSLEKHTIHRNSKIPRGKKRVTTYEKFMNAKCTSELFKSRY